jgi:hypothetical protein
MFTKRGIYNVLNTEIESTTHFKLPGNAVTTLPPASVITVSLLAACPELYLITMAIDVYPCEVLKEGLECPTN